MDVLIDIEIIPQKQVKNGEIGPRPVPHQYKSVESRISQKKNFTLASKLISNMNPIESGVTSGALRSRSCPHCILQYTNQDKSQIR